MAREENLMILKMLQDGTITAEQAAELLNAVEGAERRNADVPAAPPPPPPVGVPLPPQLTGHPADVLPPIPPVPPVPPIPPTPPIPPIPPEPPVADGEAFERARARIAAARERVAGVQEQLAAAEEKISKAEAAPNPWESLADALKDVPAARAVSEALRDPGRLAANARRQARRMARQVRHSLGDLNLDIHLNLSDMQGEPTHSDARQATAPIPPGGMLRVRNPLGDIDAQGADVPEARVAGVLKVWAPDKAAAEALAAQISLTIEQGEDGPTFTVSAPPRVRRASLDLKVFVPQGIKVSLLSPSGDVTARNIRAGVVVATQSGDARAMEVVGDVAAETASGDVALQGIVGNATASSASGDIQAIRITGQTFRAVSQSGDIELSEATIPVVTVETVSGDLDVQNLTGRSLRLRSVSGDVSGEAFTFSEEIHAEAISGSLSLAPGNPLREGNFVLNTVSGDIALTLPKETNATLEITTRGGDVKATFRGANNEEKTLNASGLFALADAIGTGSGTRLTLSTVSGDVSISQATPTVESA